MHIIQMAQEQHAIYFGYAFFSQILQESLKKAQKWIITKPLCFMSIPGRFSASISSLASL